MAWRLAKSLVKLREQINALYPNRDRASDGTIGDQRHRASKSDHNPNRAGVVQAIDIDEDLSQGLDAMPIVNALVASRDPRIKYIIYEGRMIRSYRAKNGTPPWTWTKYTGSNPHKHHFHLSVVDDPVLYDDAREWDLAGTGAPISESAVELPRVIDIRRGQKGEAVRRLQTKLIELGFTLDVDGAFGPATERAVRAFQSSRGLRADGIVGPRSASELGF